LDTRLYQNTDDINEIVIADIYVKYMNDTNNYTNHPDQYTSDNNNLKTLYKMVYERIQKLDAELREARCWTFTDLMNASKVYSPDDTSNPLKWPLEDKNVTE
jgi:transcription termination factor NusB